MYSSDSYSYHKIIFWGNLTTDDEQYDFDSNLVPVEDVSVDAVLTSLFFNSIVCVLLLITYQCFRRIFPAVYSSRKRLVFVRDSVPQFQKPGAKAEGPLDDFSEDRRDTAEESSSFHLMSSDDISRSKMLNDASVKSSFSDERANDWMFSRGERGHSTTLPDDKPLDWVTPVFGVAWSKVRKIAGLDGYFFLRYLRMCVRITAVSTFWFYLILVPIYMTGTGNAQGWYHMSASNIEANTWRMWMPVLFAYLFSAFIFFVVKQEYRHFLELRQDFLARGSVHVDPQHHYSLMIENIPLELRSDRALFEYFDSLFPGKVHSASVVLKASELEKTSDRCLRTCRRLEKSIAYLRATGERPIHKVGQGRLSIMGMDLSPIDWTYCAPSACLGNEQEPLYLNIGSLQGPPPKPRRGTRVDSISYYTHELARNSFVLRHQQRGALVRLQSGSQRTSVETWYGKYVAGAGTIASRIMEDSLIENSLLSPSNSESNLAQHVEQMTSTYGAISFDRSEGSTRSRVQSERLQAQGRISTFTSTRQDSDVEASYQVPFGGEQYDTRVRKWAGRMGLDFVVATLRVINKQVDVTLESVVGSTMSSTGFVTFLDLTSTTCAASAPLTMKAGALATTMAPERRDIHWGNVHVSRAIRLRREQIANIVLFLGGILWSFPVAAIQAFAKAKYLSHLPGMDWILTFNGGALTSFVNGYLPVVALLCLVLILPLIFQQIATNYERRKTSSDIQASMLSRYFYFQLANIYVSVTAGSILKSLADILNHPTNMLPLLGESLPEMVGYFVALLVTKIMVGLPCVFVRFGALSRMLFLRLLSSSEAKLTQRELEWVYRLENVEYGWEFPTQLLVVVIVFTYAIISPVILPVGLTYFLGALMVYKKQILYVYSPVYESGGSFFPIVVQRTLFGLVCSQMTLLGYTVTRGCYYQPAALVPLPIITVLVMNYFQKTFVVPSHKLSLERARGFDRSFASTPDFGMPASRPVDPKMDFSAVGVEARRESFNKKYYGQPVLTQVATKPWMYRKRFEDPETVFVRQQLRKAQLSSPSFQQEEDDGGSRAPKVDSLLSARSSGMESVAEES